MWYALSSSVGSAGGGKWCAWWCSRCCSNCVLSLSSLTAVANLFSNCFLLPVVFTPYSLQSACSSLRLLFFACTQHLRGKSFLLVLQQLLEGLQVLVVLRVLPSFILLFFLLWFLFLFFTASSTASSPRFFCCCLGFHVFHNLRLHTKLYLTKPRQTKVFT